MVYLFRPEINMKFENNWREKSLDSLQKKSRSLVTQDDSSTLMRTCNALLKKQLKDFTTEDLRIMIGQEIGLEYLVPLAIETLTVNLFAEGDLYEGDLLKNVLKLNPEFWNEHQDHWQQVYDLIKTRRNEINEINVDTSKFDACKQGR